MNFPKHVYFGFFLALLTTVVALAGCKDKEEDAALLLQRTKDYFNFSENARWVYNIVSDSNGATETFTLQNKIRQIRTEGNSEILSYNMVRDNDYLINVRCEVGPTQFADRIGFVVEEGSEKVLSAFVWAQSHRFYAEANDEITNIGADTLNGIAYEDVWHLKTKRNARFREIKFAKGHGLIYADYRDGKKILLKEFKP